MANLFTRLTGINGRRIAMSATGAIVDKNGYGAVMADSSGVRQTAFKDPVETISSSGSVLSASGLSIIASNTASALGFTIGSPSSGQLKEIFSMASATTLVVETSGSGIFFVSTGASSSALTFSGASGQYGQTTTLRGISSSRWAVLIKTGQIT